MYHTDGMRKEGFTLLEVMLAVALLAVAIAGIGTMMTATTRHAEFLREHEMAEATAISVVEEVQYLADTAFPSLVAYFDDDPANDPEGFGTAPGNTMGNLAVPGLSVSPESPTDQLVEILLHLDETENNPLLGLPRDLDGDGSADNPNVSGSYLLVPVTIRIHWAHRGAAQLLQMETLATKH